MIKPTPDQVTEYAKSIDFDLDGELFCDFYISKGWMVGKSPMVDWKAAVRTWKRAPRRKQSKLRLLPMVGKVCGVDGCKFPAVYKSSGSYDHWYCTKHMPNEVKEYYD